MRKEDEMISLFFWLHLDEDEKNYIERLLKTSLDWDYIFRKIKTQGIASFVFRHLDHFKFNNHLPPHIYEGLKGNYYANYRHNMVLIKGAGTILKEFAREGIQAIVLKGVFLAETIYGDIGVRPVGDTDILIKREEVAKANRILNALEYRTPAYYDDALKTHITSLNSLVYRRERRMRNVIHLHWHIINSSWPLDYLADTIDMERIWACAEPAMIGGVAALTLSPEHCVIYLAHHGFHHHFDRLILAIDIREALRYYQHRFNWELAGREAQQFGLTFIVSCSLELCTQALQFKIPPLERIKPLKLGFLEKIISFCIHRGKKGYFVSYCAYLSMEEGLLAQLRFIARTFFPSAYVMAHNYECAPSHVTFGLYCRRLAEKV